MAFGIEAMLDRFQLPSLQPSLRINLLSPKARSRGIRVSHFVPDGLLNLNYTPYGIGVAVAVAFVGSASARSRNFA